MRVSELSREVVAEHCRLIEEDLTAIESVHLDALKDAAVNFCSAYTGLTVDQLDEHEDITIAVLTLISDMYDNRLRYVDKANLNRTTETILGMHCVNLIPEEVLTNVD